MSGVEMTEKELLAILERYGVKRIAAEGQVFDPHVHEALYEIPDASVPHGTVLQVVQPGYIIHDRTLRPARVGIARGGPKPGTPPETGPEATGEVPEADDTGIEFPRAQCRRRLPQAGRRWRERRSPRRRVALRRRGTPSRAPARGPLSRSSHVSMIVATKVNPRSRMNRTSQGDDQSGTGRRVRHPRRSIFSGAARRSSAERCTPQMNDR